MIQLCCTEAGRVTVAPAGMTSIPGDSLLFLGSLQGHNYMCPSYSHNHGPQGVINISSLYATFLPKERIPEPVKDYTLEPSTRHQEAKQLFPPLFLSFLFFPWYPTNSFLFSFKLSGLRRSNNLSKAERGCTWLFNPQQYIKQSTHVKISKPLPDVTQR